MAALVRLVLPLVYGTQLPLHLFWLGDSTLTEKPYAERIHGLRWFHRSKRVAGCGKDIKGYCFACAALLCESADEQGRVRANQVVYFAPRRQPKKERMKTFGAKCRVDRLLKEHPERLRKTDGTLRVHGKTRAVKIYDAEILLCGVWARRTCEARVVIVVVPSLPKLKVLADRRSDAATHPSDGSLRGTATDRGQLYGGANPLPLNGTLSAAHFSHVAARSNHARMRCPVMLTLRFQSRNPETTRCKRCQYGAVRKPSKNKSLSHWECDKLFGLSRFVAGRLVFTRRFS